MANSHHTTTPVILPANGYFAFNKGEEGGRQVRREDESVPSILISPNRGGSLWEKNRLGMEIVTGQPAL